MKFKEALQILNEIHFGAAVIRSGRARGMKRIWWVTLDGINMGLAFPRDTTWEKIIEFAKGQPPAWDKSWSFSVGDIIEFDWFYGQRVQGIILSRKDSCAHYSIQSSAFSGYRNSQGSLGNYDLTFHRKATKLGGADS